MKISIILVSILLFSAASYATEDISVNYDKVMYRFSLPDPFGAVDFSAEVNGKDKNLLNMKVKGHSINVSINKKIFSKFNKVNLNNIRIFQGVSSNFIKENDDIISKNNIAIEDFSICLDYGEFREGVRLNNKGWYKNVLLILIKSSGDYELIDYPVEIQNIPSSACVYK